MLNSRLNTGLKILKRKKKAHSLWERKSSSGIDHGLVHSKAVVLLPTTQAAALSHCADSPADEDQPRVK